MPEVDSDLILTTLKGWVAEKKSIDAETWLTAALKLATLLEDEHLALIDAEQAYAKVRLDIIAVQSKKSVALADATAETTPEYRVMRLQKLRNERIEEIIRLAKRYASINEYK